MAAEHASAALGTAHDSELPAAAATTKKLIGAVRLESRHAGARGHLQSLEHLARARIQPAQLALVTLPSGVPQLAIDPGDASDKAIGLDSPEHRPGLRIDLMDLAGPILPDPQSSLGPRQSRVTAAAGRRNRSEHAPA